MHSLCSVSKDLLMPTLEPSTELTNTNHININITSSVSNVTVKVCARAEMGRSGMAS